MPFLLRLNLIDTYMMGGEGEGEKTDLKSIFSCLRCCCGIHCVGSSLVFYGWWHGIVDVHVAHVFSGHARFHGVFDEPLAVRSAGRHGLLVALGIGQGVQQVEVLAGLLREVSWCRQCLHDALARSSRHGLGDDARLAVGDSDVVIVAADGARVDVLGVVLGLFRSLGISANRAQQSAIPLVDDLHRNHGPTQTELHGLRWRQLQWPPEVEVGTVGGSRVGEDELTIFETNCRVACGNGAVVQHHVGTGRASQEEGTAGIALVRFEQGAEGELESRVEQALRHLVLGGDE
mmetsp:Transcript_10944/g.31373  ORF Transcript_10944/g.31373 Transcript_10944/m.31373 type:complete len:290 (-) Transcript_10944:1937-2806(-)